MNERMHESAYFMKMLTGFTPGMVGYWTKELRATFASQEYLKWFGKSKEEIGGIAVQDLLGEELFRKHEPYIRAALAGEPQTFDYTLTLPDDEKKDTLVHYIPHRDSNEVLGIFVLILDFAGRKNLEQALIAAAEERQRLAGCELHDNLGQQIAAIAYQAQVLERKIAAAGGVAESKIAASIAAQAQDAVRQCKHFARGLLTLELETGNLTDALQAFAANIAATYGIACGFVCPEKIVIGDAGLALNLYRIAQEATHNAIDHGAAKHVTISLEEKQGKLRLSIRDDGCGFAGAKAKRAAAPGMGVKIMQYRANQIGAVLKFLPRVTGGTEVLLER